MAGMVRDGLNAFPHCRIFGLAGSLFVTLLSVFPGRMLAENVARGAAVEASSEYGEYVAEHAVDGNAKSADARWLTSPEDDQPWLTLTFDRPRRIKAVSLVLDPNAKARWLECAWRVENDAGGEKGRVLGRVENNTDVRSLVTFAPVTTDRIRITFMKNSPRGNINRVHEVEVWSADHNLDELSDLSAAFPVPAFPEDARWEQPAAFQWRQTAGKPVVVDDRQRLFVDNYLILESRNLLREQQEAEKHPDNPLLKGDNPWEDHAVAFPSVLRINDKWHMWYLAHGLLHKSREPNSSVPIEDSSFLCYATSDDGIQWTKPVLGHIEFRASRQNNIVLRHQGSHFDSFSVFYRPNETYPFKMMLYQGRWPYKQKLIEAKGFQFGIDDWGHFPFQSKDGVHWEYMQERPRPVDKVMDRSNVAYDTRRDLYLGCWKFAYKGVRSRRYAESPDLLQWSPKRWLLIPQWLKDKNSRVDPVGTHFYGHLIYNYGALYLGTLEILDNTDHRMHLQIMSSRDLKHWNRMAAPKPFLPHGGKPDSWDWGVVMMAGTPPIRHNGRLYYYYDGANYDHSRGDRTGRERCIGLATLPVDRFAAIQPDDLSRDGMLTTVPVQLKGDQLHLNGDASEGMISVELLDETGNVLPGFGRDDCNSLMLTDTLDSAIGWKDRNALPDQPVQVRFVLSSARLFSFWIE